VSEPSLRPILDGLKVVELSAFVAAPLGGATLASLGAEVVRVDPPGGGIDAHRWPLHRGHSLYWAGLNQGKRSVAIDTRTEAGQELVTRLIADAGIVLTNLPTRGWNEYERLVQDRRDLIMAVLTGNPDGTSAVDYTVNAAIGFPFLTGPEDWEGPVNHVLPAWDALAGYLLAAGLLAAELHRSRTGEGQLLTLSLADVALAVAGHLGLIGEAQLNETPRGRFGNDLYGAYSRDFTTAEGRYVIVVALTPRQWQSLIEATGLSSEIRDVEVRHGADFRREGDRFERRQEISRLLGAWIGSRPYVEVQEAFDRHGVLWGPYQTFKELVREDPRCSLKNPLFAELDQPGIGTYLRAGSPLNFGRASRVPPKRSPLMGEDTDSVLRDWLGLDNEQLNALSQAGVTAGGVSEG
jgi:2-methylfumaryl-CoA isomerase